MLVTPSTKQQPAQSLGQTLSAARWCSTSGWSHSSAHSTTALRMLPVLPCCRPVLPAHQAPADTADTCSGCCQQLPAPTGTARGGRGGPGCPANTHQLGRFNLHLPNRLVAMGTREICGLCSKSLFSHHPRALTWAGGPPGCAACLEEMPLGLPSHQQFLAEHQNPTFLPFFFLVPKEIFRR